MATLDSIELNPDAEGKSTATGAGVTVGPVTLYPPLRAGGRGSYGQTVAVLLAGTDYSTAVLSGRMDPSDANDWVAVAGVTVNVATATTQLYLLPFDFAEIKLVTTGGDGTSTAKLLVGP